MTLPQQIITIGVAALATLITRFLPFIIFPAGKKTPATIQKLAKVLPGAVLGMLVIYCFKNLPASDFTTIWQQGVAAVVVVGLHLWRRNLFLSIFVGTAVYMLLLNFL